MKPMEQTFCPGSEIVDSPSKNYMKRPRLEMTTRQPIHGKKVYSVGKNRDRWAERAKEVKDMEKRNCYESSDIWFSAFVICSGGNLLSTYRSDGRTVFVFDEKNKIEKLEREYLTGKGKVGAKKFVDAFRGIKSLLYRIQ